MEILPALSKFNTVALTVVLLMALPLAGYSLLSWLQYSSDYHVSPAYPRADNDIGGQRIEAGDRILTLYSRTKLNDEFVTDLRFVDGRNGVATKLGRDAKQEMYGGSVVGVRHREQSDSGYGYYVRAKTGERSGQPTFDVLFLRFSDMKTFTVASDVLAADENELDGKTFSMVMWDAEDRAKFVLFDAEAGRVLVTKDLEMKGAVRSEAKPAPESLFQ